MAKELREDLIIRAQSGDTEAISAIYQSYKQPIYRFLFYKLGDRQSAEDLTTEVFLRVIEALPRYGRRSGTFQGWIYQIAHNLAIDHFRRMTVRAHGPLQEEFVAQDETPEAAVARSMNQDHLAAALRRLTEEQCDVIVLRIIAEMSVGQVAETLRKSESAVKALQARGLESLYRILSQRKESYETSS